ncbi:MAG: MBOAT family O-acyltransferase [Bacteroidales bacterium]
MLFNSLEFLFFLPIVVTFYFLINPRFRWVLLLFASYYFYMAWDYKYIVLILTSTIIDYVSGIIIYRAQRKSIRKLLLVLSLITNLGLLFFFKYFNFFGQNINYLFDQFNIFAEVPAYDYLLPVGISFYTFQTLSYTIDIYRGKQTPEYHFGRFALFVSFFPQLVAGPIERSVNLLPQFRETFSFDYDRIRDGIMLMLWGFFKKVVIADRLAEYVNMVYQEPELYGGFQNALATLFFSFQIYCDFSGYSDIAIGTALIMGYRLMTNFRRPYLAASIREFWQRWHISLSTWFRDYVYIPLGGNRVAKWRWNMNLFITFTVSGLWHGAEWTFVIWGALHGFYLMFALWTRHWQQKFNDLSGLSGSPALLRTSQALVTFVLVFISWVFFRAMNTPDAFLILGKIIQFDVAGPINLFRYSVDMYISAISIILLLSVEILEERFRIYEKIKTTSYRTLKWVILMMLLLTILVLGIWEEVDFIYFQF